MSTAAGVLSPIREDRTFSMGYGRRRISSLLDDSILVYLTVAGSTIPMRILETDSIASVKLKIQRFKGFLKSKQMLVHGGRELARNDSLIKDYGVSDGNVLHLIVRLSELLAITVKTECGKELEFQVERYRNIGYLKQMIARKVKEFSDLKKHELICNGEELDDLSRVDDVCNDGEAVLHLIVRKNAQIRRKQTKKDYELSIVASKSCSNLALEKWINSDFESLLRKQSNRDYWLEPVIVNPAVRLAGVLKDLIDDTAAGLEKGYAPTLSAEGTGGAYFLFDVSGSKHVAVFKPIDEEPKAKNNPQGFPISLDGEGLKRGTRVGEGAYREVAAYILDHPKSGRRIFSDNAVGFSGVPPTVMARCLHRGFNHPEGFDLSAKNFKVGSLQTFVKNYGSCEDIGPGAFPAQEVHKISVLDIRLANADRHAGNILISKEGDEGKTILIPIDHGYCLPENFEDCTFDWLYWPQSREPYSAETIDYIMSMDAELDIVLLKFHGWELSLGCSRTLRISTMLLKKGVKLGMSPFEIGSIMCREIVNRESVLEEIVHEAREGTLPGMSEAAFMDDVSRIMDRRLNEISARKGI